MRQAGAYQGSGIAGLPRGNFYPPGLPCGQFRTYALISSGVSACIHQAGGSPIGFMPTRWSEDARISNYNISGKVFQ